MDKAKTSQCSVELYIGTLYVVKTLEKTAAIRSLTRGMESNASATIEDNQRPRIAELP